MSIASQILFKRIQITAKQNGVLPMKKKRVENIGKQQKKNKEEETFKSTRWWHFENYSAHPVERPGVIISITPREKILVIPSDIYVKAHGKEVSN